MQALAFWKAVAHDQSNFLDALIALLHERRIRYCVIGGRESMLTLHRWSALIFTWLLHSISFMKSRRFWPIDFKWSDFRTA